MKQSKCKNTCMFTAHICIKSILEADYSKTKKKNTNRWNLFLYSINVILSRHIVQIMKENYQRRNNILEWLKTEQNIAKICTFLEIASLT